MLVIAALDMSERDRLVLDQCRHIAAGAPLQVKLLHVVSLPKSLLPGNMREAAAYLDTVRAHLNESGMDVSDIVTKGDVAAEIIRTADEYEADLVVVGTRGRKGWDRLALGSVTEAVLSHSSRPVLIVNEANLRARLDEETRRKSSYMAAVIWAKHVRGELTETEAELELARLAEAGLDRLALFSNYRALVTEGVPAEWLDMHFQIETLDAFLPSEIAWLRAPEEKQDEEAA